MEVCWEGKARGKGETKTNSSERRIAISSGDSIVTTSKASFDTVNLSDTDKSRDGERLGVLDRVERNEAHPIRY